jgi:hypothetical protein
MQMLRNLLEKVNRIWYENSRISPTLTLRKGTGQHHLLTIESGILSFHSLPYSKYLTQSQEIHLDDMTVNDVVTTARGMGYDLTVINSNIAQESALVLLEVANRSLLNDGETLYGFTSNLWRVMYPFHRKLTEAGNDIDVAVEQILLPSARGEWLDYWVGFFKIKRLRDETDEMLLRRAFLSINRVKANDVAIEELVSFYINAVVKVQDYLPAKFEVRVTPEYMSSAQKIHDLIKTLKGAGVDYILNYAVDFSEDYPVSFRSFKGDTFPSINQSYRTVSVNFGKAEEDYTVIPAGQALSGFILNSSRLNSTHKLSISDKRIIERVSMVMTQGGTIIKEM